MQICKSIKDPQKKKITLGTKEWADYNVNCIKGCYNDCRYCYARVMSRRFHRSTDDSWKEMRLTSVVNMKFGKKSGRAMFPSTHDLFDFHPFKEACFTVLENLLKEHNEVLITTKPRPMLIKELIETFDCYKEQIQFRFTITSKSDELLRFWEPNAPSYHERFESLKYAFDEGFKTSVSIEPFLDPDPFPLIQAIEPYVTESIWLGRMNYIARTGLTSYEKKYYDKVRKNYEVSRLIDLLTILAGHPKIRIKDSIRNQLLGKCRFV